MQRRYSSLIIVVTALLLCALLQSPGTTYPPMSVASAETGSNEVVLYAPIEQKVKLHTVDALINAWRSYCPTADFIYMTEAYAYARAEGEGEEKYSEGTSHAEASAYEASEGATYYHRAYAVAYAEGLSKDGCIYLEACAYVRDEINGTEIDLPTEEEKRPRAWYRPCAGKCYCREPRK